MQDDRKFWIDTLHCRGEKIASDAGDDILSPNAAISAIAVATILELSGCIIGKHDALLTVVTDDAWVWISQLAAARQVQQQESANALEGDTAAIDNTAGLTNSHPGRMIEVMPEFFDRWMQRSPFALELLDLLVGEAIGLEFSPSIFGAHITESQIAGFADSALRRFLVIRAVRHPEDLACGDAVRLLARVACCVEAAILIEFPLLAGDPG